MVNSVDPDETACYEMSHLDLHCSHRYWFWSARLKGFKPFHTVTVSVLIDDSLMDDVR